MRKGSGVDTTTTGQPGLTEIRDTVTDFNILIRDLGHESMPIKHGFQTHVFELEVLRKKWKFRVPDHKLID